MIVALVQDTEFASVDAILERRGGEKGALIPILQEAQEVYGYLPRPILARISERLGLPFNQVYGVATFYAQFYLTRRGKNVIKVCDGTACHVRGASSNIEALKRDLGVEPGKPTPDYQFTYEVVYCLGACALGPVVVVNGNVKGRCSADRVHRFVNELNPQS